MIVVQQKGKTAAETMIVVQQKHTTAAETMIVAQQKNTTAAETTTVAVFFYNKKLLILTVIQKKDTTAV